MPWGYDSRGLRIEAIACLGSATALLAVRGFRFSVAFVVCEFCRGKEELSDRETGACTAKSDDC